MDHGDVDFRIRQGPRGPLFLFCVLRGKRWHRRFASTASIHITRHIVLSVDLADEYSPNVLRAHVGRVSFKVSVA